jgi:hypothetical protein
MSSRSLAAARARRAGENAPPVSGNRPGTSIGSYAAFGQPPPNPQQNVRVARGPQNAYQQPVQQNAYQQPQQVPPQQQNPNGLPFTKLSISDAIGLITIRLGRVEQWIIETDHENEENEHSNHSVSTNNFDSSILTNFASRLDSLEKREPVSGNTSSEEVTKLIEDVGKMNTHLEKIVEESSKHSLITSKHTEQLFRFERELIETKDILKTFMLKYDQFASETSDKFGDFEYAISELEKNVVPSEEDNEKGSENLMNNDNTDTDSDNQVDELQTSSIMSVDLKNLIKQELATSIDE